MINLPIIEIGRWENICKHIFVWKVKMMKKHRIFTCAVILIFIAIFTAVLSCSNFSIPESVEIKTGARYALDIGFDILDMSEYLSPKTIQSAVGNSFNVYDYNPGGTSPIKHFLVEYPAINQSIDISKHFENLDFGADANNSMGFDETFKVESIDMHPKFGPLKAGNGMEYSLDDPKAPVKITIGSLGDANLVSAIIKTGHVILSVKEPSSWDNNLTLSLENGGLSGGITKPNAFTTQTKPGFLLYAECNLTNSNFEPKPVQILGKVKVNGTSSSVFDFDLNLDLEVTKYESVTVDIGKVNTTFNFNKALPSELSNFVKSITCDEVGVKFNYRNNLPTASGGSGANDVSITMTSDFLNLPNPGQTEILQNDGVKRELHVKPSGQQILKLSPPPASTNLDIKVDLVLPGGNATLSNGDRVITVHDIQAGQTYSLAFTDFQLVLDWAEIKVDSSKLKQNGTVDLPIDFNSMFNDIKNSVNGLSGFVDKLEVGKIPVYMYVAKPAENSFNNLGITVSKLEMTRTSGGGSIGLLPSGQTINMTDKPLPGLEKDKSVRTDFSKLVLDYLTPLNDTAFQDIINNKNTTGLKLDYGIAFGNNGDLDISKSTVDTIKASGGTLDIKATVYIDIPLKLTLGSDVDIDLMKMAGMDAAGTDLMGRSEPLSFGEAEKYMDAVKSVDLMMSLQNSVFVDAPSGKINFVIDDSSGKNILGKKEYPLSNLKIGLTYDEVKKVLKSAPPYMPTIKINFPKDSGFQLPQSSAKFGFSGKVAVTTDGSIIIGEGK